MAEATLSGWRPALVRLGWRLDTRWGRIAMFAVALGVRLAIAPFIGFYGDIHLFQEWAQQIAQVGTHRFYGQSTFVDYPPGYLYVLWLVGKISATPGYLLIKLPAIVGDLALGWLAGIFAERLAPASLRERVPVRTAVTAAVLFNPAVIALSSVWGQVDALPAAVVMGALLLVFTGRHSIVRDLSGCLVFAAAVAMKPQAGFAVPVIAYCLYRRYLHRRVGASLVDGALTCAWLALAALGLWAISGLLFGLGPIGLYDFYSRSASEYPDTSANAFNLWGILGAWRNDSTGSDVFQILGVDALHVGMALFIVAALAVLWRTHRAIERGGDEARTLTLAAAVTSLLAYTLLTRMHERYAFISIALFAPLLFAVPIRKAWAAFSLLFIVNLWYPFAYYNLEWSVQALKIEPLYGWLYGGLALETWQKRVISALFTLLALAVSWRSLAWISREAADVQPDESAAGAGAALTLAAPAPPSQQRFARAPATAASTATPPPPPSSRNLAATPPPPGAGDFPSALRALSRRAGSWSDWPWVFHVRSWTLAGRDEGGRERHGASFWAPLSLVALACGFGLVTLRAQLRHAENLNDSSFHLLMVRWATGQIHEGHLPLDGWFPYLTLGSSFFHHYQSLPQTLTAYVSVLTGVSDWTTYLWFLYLLLALWPIAVYLSARLFDFDRWTAGAAACIAPFLVSASGYGFEQGSYVWQGYGIYSQLWVMWILPIAWALTWRAVARGRYLASAAIALALTIACHFIAGYLAVLTVGVWVLILGGGLLRRIGRGAIVAIGSMLIASWVLVPLISDDKYSAESAFYVGTFYNNSYGADTVLGWLVHGNLFDDGRFFPVVTVLCALGFVACLSGIRDDLRARGLLGAFVLSLLLFFGRPTLGRLLNVLPGFQNVQIQRFIMGVDMAGILLAGVALGFVLRTAYTQLQRLGEVQLFRRARIGAVRPWESGLVCVALAVGMLSPAWLQLYHYENNGAKLISAQMRADASEGPELDKLIDIVKRRHDGRIYAGLRSNWGADYLIDDVPVYAWLADQSVDAVGFTFRTVQSLSTDIEASFTETDLAQYQMLNIRYLLLPSGHPPPVPAKLIATAGPNELYQVQTTGYFQVVDRSAALSANNADIGAATATFRDSDLALHNIYPGVAFAGGGPAPPATFSGATPPAGAPGEVLSQSNVLQNGVFSATVVARRTAVVLLKATYDPRWTATVDGVPVKPVMMAPSLVGVEVPPGRHVVVFRYRDYAGYPELLTLGLLTLLALILLPRRGRAILQRIRERRSTTIPRGGSEGASSNPTSSPIT